MEFSEKWPSLQEEKRWQTVKAAHEHLKCCQHLELLLESILSMFQNNRIIDSAFWDCNKGYFLGDENFCGKLLVFQSGKLINMLIYWRDLMHLQLYNFQP
ncbi:transport Sec24-like At4g32640 [Olea europaea subsp. europaea]|uniref:Transport Sec24-like At4g32640 n=1 Tax=Olea europaea subsp. europaea TaxID=158383 RepID=A0A8S0QDZ5_OLEEU|nr:transport Sec24-like At4g32640 [Olea europaea subsp. europaea]